MSKEILIPELRFPEFMNEGKWVSKTIGEVFNSFSGGTPITSNKEYYGGNIPFIRSAEINKEKTELFITDDGLNDSSAKLVKSGDLLVALYGANSGDSAISKINGAINQAILCLQSDKSNAFAFYFLTLKKDWIVSKYIQGGQGNLSGDIIKSIDIPFPNPKEQQKIASCLSSLDEVIAAHSQKLDLLKEHKKGLMQNLFPQEGETVPKYRFKEFENDGEWVEKIFDDILEVTRLAGYEYSEYWKEDEKKEIIALRGYNIGKGTLLLHNLGYISNELSLQLNRSKLFKGDIVYPCVGTIGNAVVIEEDNKFHIQQNIAKLTPKKDISPYFISQFLMSHLGLIEVNKFNATSSQPNVLVGSLRNFKICIPKITEQQKIASCLSSLDALITAQTENIEQLKLHKKGLMQGLFPKINAN